MTPTPAREGLPELPELARRGLEYFAVSGDEDDKRYVKAIVEHIKALAALAGQPTPGGGEVDENEIAAAILATSDNDQDGSTLTEWLQDCGLTLGERLQYALRIARAVLALPQPQPDSHWDCANCGQKNSSWALECGRCEQFKNHPTPPPPSDAAQGLRPVRVDELGQEWADAYAAFKGAFDTLAAWRRQGDELATDARERLRKFNERMETLSAHKGERNG